MEKSEFNRAFGKYLKEKRVKIGWSQTDLASALGNNPQNVSRIERGELTPTIYWIEKLAIAFECKASEIIAEFENSRNKNV